MPTPAPGQLVFEFTPDGVRLDQADELIWVSDHFIEHPTEWATIDGDVLTLTGTNTTVRYRLGAQVPGHDARQATRLDDGT